LLNVHEDPVLLVASIDNLDDAAIFHDYPAGSHKGQHGVVGNYDYYLPLAGEQPQSLLLLYASILDLVDQDNWRVANASYIGGHQSSGLSATQDGQGMPGVYWFTGKCVGHLYDFANCVAILSPGLGMHPQEFLDGHICQEVHILGQLGH
jgi:hypothetical protein